MKTMFKRIAASVMAVTSISVNAVGITAYAETIKEDAGNNMAAEECKGDP